MRLTASLMIATFFAGALCWAGCRNAPPPAESGPGATPVAPGADLDPAHYPARAGTRLVAGAPLAPVAPVASAVRPVTAPVDSPAVAAPGPHAKPGFATALADGRLWVFAEGSAEYRDFVRGHEPAKNLTMVRAGPGGLTLKGVDRATLLGYLAAVPGFETFVEEADQRVWVFRLGSEDLAVYRRTGEPAKSVTLVKAGPAGLTVRAPDTTTAIEYVTWRPGFVTRFDDDAKRLWVFRPDSADLAEFERAGEPARHITRVKAGPRGLTIKAPDIETLYTYMATAPGFETVVQPEENRVWVFSPGSEELAEFRRVGEPAKHVTRPAAGPLRLTVKAPDREILDLYLRAVGN